MVLPERTERPADKELFAAFLSKKYGKLPRRTGQHHAASRSHYRQRLENVVSVIGFKGDFDRQMRHLEIFQSYHNL